MPGARVRLIPDDLTGRAGEPAARPRNQTDRTKWTDRIRGGRNGFKFLAKREVPGNAKQTDGKKNRPGRRGKPSNPADDRKAGINRKRPERDRGADQRTQCSPPEIAPHFRILMRFPAACAAYPVCPIAYGQNRDPVGVCDIKVRGPGFAFFGALNRAYMVRSAQRRDLSCPLCLMPPTLSPLWRARKRPCCGRSPSWTTSGPVPSPRPRVAVATPVAIAIAHRIPVTDLIFA
jgi:hypothetical protein